MRHSSSGDNRINGKAVLRLSISNATKMTLEATTLNMSVDIIMGAGLDVDCATNGGYLKPRRLSQSAQPTPDVGELLIWRDSDDSKTYLVYNDTTEGVRKVEML